MEDGANNVCSSMGGPLKPHFQFIATSTVHDVNGNPAPVGFYTIISRWSLENLRGSGANSHLSHQSVLQWEDRHRSCRVLGTSEGH